MHKEQLGELPSSPSPTISLRLCSRQSRSKWKGFQRLRTLNDSVRSSLFPRSVTDKGHEQEIKHWEPRNWCFRTVVLENSLQSPLNCKEIKLVNPKGNQPWIFIWGTDAEAQAPIYWPHDMKSWLIRKDPDAGKDWGQEEKEVTEDEMVGWHHQLNGPEFEQTQEDSEGQESLECCSPWSHKKLDTTLRLNNKSSKRC